ncbi:MAG: MipA/OmpV family protein [Kiloniellales bacterium]|nr:MipA/OmpV family protein [Kiloniellales bacterium]
MAARLAAASADIALSLSLALVASALVIFMASQALAQDSGSDNWQFKLGAGLGIAPDYEGSEDYDIVPLPNLAVQKGHRYGELLGTKIESNLINHPNWRLGPSANFRSGYNDVSDKRVDNLTDRGSSFELGLSGGYVFEFDQLLFSDASIELGLEFLHDVSSGHEGWLLTPSVTYAAPISDSWSLSTGVETTYASGNYMSHYFSINSSDAANSGLDNFDADADFKDFALNVGAGYEISRRWDLSLLTQYKLMLGDAEDSPVVDDQGEEHQFFGGFVISYTWGK